jgi:glutathione S-transferase
MLFGHFTIADAFFAPVVTRFVTYGAPVPAAVKGYVDRVLGLRSVSAWYRDAQDEHDFLQFEENYRTARA